MVLEKSLKNGCNFLYEPCSRPRWRGGGEYLGGYLGNLVPRALFSVFKVGLEISHPTSKAREKRLKTRLVLGLIFAGYVPLASQSPYPIIVYSVANYRPHISHFRANM